MFKHIKKDIHNLPELLSMIGIYKKHNPDVCAFDTETTGLNIGLDTPFLFQWGWIHEDTIHTYTVHRSSDAIYKGSIEAFFSLVDKYEPLVLGHNVKFDLHMLKNIDIRPVIKNISDTQVYIRLAHDALTPENGGPPLGLKEYAAQFIDREAKFHEKKLKEEQGAIAKNYNAELLKALKPFPNPPEGYKSWTKGALENLFKDVLATPEWLPTEEMRDVYYKWYDSIPDQITKRMTTPFVTREDIPYNMLNTGMLIAYGHMDIYYTLCVYVKTAPVIECRKQQAGLELENKCIYPLFHMEGVGFYIDKQYVYDSRDRMYNYMIQRKQDLKDLLGADIGIGQHGEIRNIILNKYGVNLEATNDTYLGIKIPELVKAGQEEVVAILNLIKELRTLDKWYAVYLLRFVNELKRHDRVYTQIHQAGTVSGRVTSDFQQFPKFGIKDKDDNDLFNPRQMVIRSKEYKGLIYLDYSQIELRFQAFYTILVGSPDKNLCRAYMPYECYYLDTKDKESDPLWREQDHRWVFDYTNPAHIAVAYKKDWVHIEDDKPWHKTDVHSATTALAFPELDPDSDQFKKMRGKVGKRVNFAKNYGAKYNKIATMFPDFKFSEEKLHEIDDAYYAAFPGVKAYHQYCYDIAQHSRYATNLFGVRYYGQTGHKLINTLVQGSAAYFLKLKIIEIQEFLLSNKYKSRFQMNIHDELSFELAEGEEEIIPVLQNIMQNYPDTLVPIVADLEVSKTSWAAKEEAEGIEDVKRILS